MEDKIRVEYHQLLNKIKEEQNNDQTMSFHLLIMFKYIKEKKSLSKILMENFNDNKALHWKLLLDTRIFYNEDEEIIKFRKEKLTNLGFSSPYLIAQQLGKNHVNLSIDIKQLDINTKKLEFMFDNIIHYDSLGLKHIFLSKDESYFNNLSISKNKEGFFSLYGRYARNHIIKEKNINELMIKIKSFIEK